MIIRMFSAVLTALALFALAPAYAQQSPQGELWGIYGEHTAEDCPLFNRERGKAVLALARSDMRPLMQKHGVIEIVDQYHSGLEHTFLWVVRTNRPHQLQDFTTEMGVASWNNLRIVPIRRFAEDVVPEIQRLHNLK